MRRSKPGIPAGSPGRLLLRVTGFVGQHPILGPSASFALLPADFLDARLLRRHAPGLELFNLVQQQPPGDEPVEPLLTGGLALDLKTGWAMQQHDASGRFVDVLTAMPAGPHKTLLNVGLPHPQRRHAQGELLCLFRIYGKRTHFHNLTGQPGNLKGPPGRQGEAKTRQGKKAVFLEPRVKKTYLTKVYWTAVFACKIKGFVPEKNRFREAVKIWASLSKQPNERGLLRQMRAVGGHSIASAIETSPR